MTEQHPPGQDHLTPILLLMGALVALTVLAPLTLPVAFAAAAVWYVVGGRARWLLLAGVILTAGAVAIVGPDAVLAGWHRWASAQLFTGTQLGTEGPAFLLGFGPVGPA